MAFDPLFVGKQDPAIGTAYSEKQLDELNVMDFGVDNTGVKDCTHQLQLLHRTGKRIYYPNGTYLFNGLTLDLSGGVRFESPKGVVVRNHISGLNILQFDDDGHLIGLMQNHLEFDERSVAGNYGSLVSPPLSRKRFQRRVDVLAYWYNDFGLQCQKLSHVSWIGWYYWTWNHHGCENDAYLREINESALEPYDPARHPLLGFYYGDDAVVLDWQCYWLYEYGVSTVILQNGYLENWEEPAATAYWIYQLFHNVPNFWNLRYIMGAPTPWFDESIPDTHPEALRKQWRLMLEKTYLTHENYYFMEIDGQRYPVLCAWEEAALLSIFDPQGGAANVREFYLEITRMFQKAGFGGMAILCRNPILELQTPEERTALEKLGLYRYHTSYVGNCFPQEMLEDGTTYPEVVQAFDPPADPYLVQSVAVSMISKRPHPSHWRCYGNTPAWFKKWIDKAVEHLDRNPDMPRMITCYNVSEWSEGGAGLQPNVRDRFDYLKAMKKALVIKELRDHDKP